MKDICSWRKRSKKIVDEKCVEWKGGKTIIGNHGFHFLQRLSIRKVSWLFYFKFAFKHTIPSITRFFLYKKCLICLLPSYVLELELGRSREIEDWVQVIIFYLYECTVVGEYINIIKTTLDSNFDIYQAFKHIKSDTLAWKQREAANLQLPFLYFLTCNLIKASKKQSSLYWYKRRSLGWA